MTGKEKKLVSDLLKLAADKFGNHGCNDLDEDIWEGWNDEERRQLISEYHISNGEPEEAEEGHTDVEDFVLMYHMANKVLE